MNERANEVQCGQIACMHINRNFHSENLGAREGAESDREPNL